MRYKKIGLTDDQLNTLARKFATVKPAINDLESDKETGGIRLDFEAESFWFHQMNSDLDQSDFIQKTQERLLSCGEPIDCRLPICSVCRHKYRERYRRKNISRFSRFRPSEIAHLTIILSNLEIDQPLNDVLRWWTKRLRRLLRKAGASVTNDGHLTVFGHYEVDLYFAGNYPTTKKFETLEGLNYASGDQATVLHVHIIVAGKEFRWRKLRFLLMRHFPYPRQVYISGLHANKRKRVNIRNLTGYLVKRFATRKIKAEDAHVYKTLRHDVLPSGQSYLPYDYMERWLKCMLSSDGWSFSFRL